MCGVPCLLLFAPEMWNSRALGPVSLLFFVVVGRGGTRAASPAAVGLFRTRQVPLTHILSSASCLFPLQVDCYRHLFVFASGIYVAHNLVCPVITVS